jgi:hypothetical protein
MLPRISFYSDGRDVCVYWEKDDHGAYPHMPGEFIEYGMDVFQRSDIELGFSDFISRVVDKSGTSHDPRVAGLREDWEAITRLDEDEKLFCRLAGRLGLDPFDSDRWDPGIASLLENEFNDEQPIVTDFLESGEIANAQECWAWIKDVNNSQGLNAGSSTRMAHVAPVNYPAGVGYFYARDLRSELNRQGAFADVHMAAKGLGIPVIQLENHNHSPAKRISAVIGWRGTKEPVIVGPIPERDDNRRFLEARALYHAAFACQNGPRLITQAHAWDQQASRAFAAELLAPQAELAKSFAEDAGRGAPEKWISSMAIKYQVSEKVVEHQLENAGVSVVA